MVERDWYLKEMQKLAKLLARLMGLAKSGEQPQALRLLDEAYTAMLKMNGPALVQLSDEAFEQLVTERKLSAESLHALAELQLAECEMLADALQPSLRRQYFRRAIWLWNRITHTTRSYSLEREARIRQLEQQLAADDWQDT